MYENTCVHFKRIAQDITLVQHFHSIQVNDVGECTQACVDDKNCTAFSVDIQNNCNLGKANAATVIELESVVFVVN